MMAEPTEDQRREPRKGVLRALDTGVELKNKKRSREDRYMLKKKGEVRV